MRMKNKKKILIAFTGAMELGGVERSLLGLLEAIDYTKYEVDLFLYGHHGPLFSLINSNVNLLSEVKELAYLRESLKTKLQKGCYISAFMRIKDGLLSHFRPIDYDKTWANIMRKTAPVQQKHYDIALGFFRPFDYIIEKIDADVKIGWVHTDYSTEKRDITSLQRDYEKVDYIAAVSEQCRETFVQLFPQFSDKTIVIENILSKNFILEQAEEFTVEKEMPQTGEVRLLSVGRFCEAKNFDNVPEICSLLLQKGISVKWYLIGYGGDEELICQKIEENGMQKHVIILGKKENPYPYMAACDLYVQPSRYEGNCVSVHEAQILSKPVVITNYPTSKSQLEDGVDGIIVSMDNEKCAAEIAAVIRDKELQEKLSENEDKKDYTNVGEIQKLYRLME